MLTNFLIPLLLIFTDEKPATYKDDTHDAISYTQIPDELFLGRRLLLGSMSMIDIRKQRVRVIRKKTIGEGYTNWETEQFDERGHTIYRRNWLQQVNQSDSGYNEFFTCEYGADGKLATVSATADSLRNKLTQRYAYNYTSRGQLRRAGGYRLTYYPNGLLYSVAGGGTIERYYYSAQGQLTRVEFGVEAGAVICGNTTDEWRGEYDADHLLTREVHIGLNGHTYQLNYNAVHQLIRRTSSDSTWNYECTYLYQNGLVAQTTEIYSGRAYGQKVTRNTTYEYERY